jgi:hypothetical protein
VKRDRLVFDLPQVVTPTALTVAMFTIVLAAITDYDGWMVGGLLVLIIDALLERVRDGLRG